MGRGVLVRLLIVSNQVPKAISCISGNSHFFNTYHLSLLSHLLPSIAQLSVSYLTLLRTILVKSRGACVFVHEKRGGCVCVHKKKEKCGV